MYDCQTDNYTDFDAPAAAVLRPASSLNGVLHAHSLHADTHGALASLAAHAAMLGYIPRHKGTSLLISDVSLDDALAINSRFAAQLVISCELRQDPPARHR
ncbi:hypothetical protein EHS17_11190 [Rhodobacteraceae bacterium CH30]|nr:hypothetical protein EHS17_11190 [Rhodobacteraceae bacterium CH30]